MRIAKVMGVVVSTVKAEQLEGSKMLLVKDADQTGKVTGQPYIALDIVGAGEEELVMVVQGSTARAIANKPVDAVIVCILDSLRYDNKLTFKKS
jgi:ethanolamine utilization protein EutN